MIVFWDIDDTIYDRCDAFSSACDRFLNTPAMKKRAASAGDEAHFPLPDGRIIYRFCDKRGDEVFKASQTGEISMAEMYVYRYCKGFADAGILISPEEALLFQIGDVLVHLVVQNLVAFSSTLGKVHEVLAGVVEGCAARR